MDPHIDVITLPSAELRAMLADSDVRLFTSYQSM